MSWYHYCLECGAIGHHWTEHDAVALKSRLKELKQIHRIVDGLYLDDVITGDQFDQALSWVNNVKQRLQDSAEGSR